MPLLTRHPPGGQPHEIQTEFNASLSKIRDAIERAIAYLKTWGLLSKEGGRFRPPLSKFETALKAVIGLFFFFNNCHEIFEYGASALRPHHVRYPAY
jgi:hypothetical protein